MRTPCNEDENCPGCGETSDTARYNEPGLPAIDYRLGTHGEFLERMLDLIHTDELLRTKLTTRRQDDFAIALMDAWAVVADVLSFYQERIANEGYLRTATERRSILEMARTIGYELNPGVASSTYLAFTVDENNAANTAVEIPQGTQVQNIPAQGKIPQTFETAEEFEAHAAWNELKPRCSMPQSLGIDSGGDLYLLSLPDEGDTTDALDGFYRVNPEALLPDEVKATRINEIYLSGTANNLEAGDVMLFAGSRTSGGTEERKAIVLTIASVKLDKEAGLTTVKFASTTGVFWNIVLPYLIIPVLQQVSSVQSVATDLTFNQTTVAENILNTVISEKSLQALMTVNNWDAATLAAHITAVQTAAAETFEGQGVYAFREHVGFFGNNAPAYDVAPKDKDGNDIYDDDWDNPEWPIWDEYPDGTAYGDADAFLERKVDGIGQNSWVMFTYPGLSTPLICQVDATVDRSLTGFAISGKATGLKLKTIDGSTLVKSDSFTIRNATAYVKSEALELAVLPIEDGLAETAGDEGEATGVASVMLDGMVTGLQIGQPVIVNGEQADAEGVVCHEVAVLKDIVHNLGYTILYFEDNLQYAYIRDTVTINANVVPATHGETVSAEVLGSGDGTKTNQSFVLKKPPLTYVSAATASGAESTLEVAVDGIKWQQALSLYNLGPTSPSFIVRLDNDGEVNIKFGDGKQGARLPTGQENIVATYRSGIGTDGEVDADTITLLKTRPQGVKSVTNPVPASGAEEPETMDDARTDAPLTVLTLDRIVSLQDYEDFARTYAGIGKAKAVVLWNGETDMVHITIASASGETIDAGSTTYANLCEAIDTYRDKLATVQVDTFEKRVFHVEAKLLIDGAYDADDVLEEATEALEDAFAFAKRDFGQPVTAAEVISIIHSVSGVIAVDLDKLYLAADEYATDTELGPLQTLPASVLPSARAKWPEGGSFAKAQLLLINPVGITLKEMES